MLGKFIDAVDRRRKRFIVYSAEERPELAERFATRNVTVEYRPLPSVGLAPFVTIHDDGTFAGAITLEEFKELLAPPIVRPGTREGLSEGYRALLDVLEETLFAALDRRQLLATSREIEDRARRIGRGTLRVGFQSLSVFETQLPLYRRLGAETDLDVHIYGEPDWEPPEIESVTYHEDADGALAPFWCLAFDGGPEEEQACVLIAREQAEGYLGFWSYDPKLVADVLAALRAME